MRYAPSATKMLRCRDCRQSANSRHCAASFDRLVDGRNGVTKESSQGDGAGREQALSGLKECDHAAHFDRRMFAEPNCFEAAFCTVKKKYNK